MNNFTPRALQALLLASNRARTNNHPEIRLHHILQGILDLKKGVAYAVLESFVPDPRIINYEIEKLTASETEHVQLEVIPYDPAVRTLLKTALDISKQMNHSHVGSEHIMLAILTLKEGVCYTVLSNLKIDSDDYRKKIVQHLDPEIETSKESADGHRTEFGHGYTRLPGQDGWYSDTKRTVYVFHPASWSTRNRWLIVVPSLEITIHYEGEDAEARAFSTAASYCDLPL